MHKATLQWPRSNRDHPSLGTAFDPPTCCMATPLHTHGAWTSSHPTGAFPTTCFPVAVTAEGHVGAPVSPGGHLWDTMGEKGQQAWGTCQGVAQTLHYTPACMAAALQGSCVGG